VHAIVQMLVSVVKMATVLEYTTEEQLPVVRFLWAKEINAKDIHEEMFSVYCGKCLSRKAIHNWVEDFLLLFILTADGFYPVAVVLQ
jgi:hypothetical protein